MVDYSATCDASEPGGYISMRLTMFDPSYIDLGADVTEVPNVIVGTMTTAITAPSGAGIGVVTLYVNEQGSLDNCQVTAQ